MMTSRTFLPFLLGLLALAGCGNIENGDPKPRLDSTSTPGTAYGNTLLGTKKRLDFQLRNSDASVVEVDPLENIVIGVTGVGLTFSHTCPTTLDEGDSCTISVFYEPTAVGTLAGALSVTSNVDPVSLALSATAVTTLDPVAGAVAFTAQPQGAFTSAVGQSASKTFTLRNIGNAGDALTITGPSETGWTFSEDCPATLAQASTCNIVVVFAPTVTGVSVPSQLVIKDPYNTDFGGLTVSLIGTGT